MKFLTGTLARVALGHTGRKLKASNTVTIAFVLINVAAFCRIILPKIMPKWSGIFIYLSMVAWLEAFSLFIFVYWPILVSPRVDGKES